MSETEQKPAMQELCTISIAFPVETDEQAIAYKKKISDVLADIPQVRIDFNIMSVPMRTPINARTTGQPK